MIYEPQEFATLDSKGSNIEILLSIRMVYDFIQMISLLISFSFHFCRQDHCSFMRWRISKALQDSLYPLSTSLFFTLPHSNKEIRTLPFETLNNPSSLPSLWQQSNLFYFNHYSPKLISSKIAGLAVNRPSFPEFSWCPVWNKDGAWCPRIMSRLGSSFSALWRER